MKVSNPLTIIAIFAGVAEAIATLALVNLPESIQAIFIYFVIAFPSFIVIAFFLILILKPQVLYAPSDYDNQDHFLLANKFMESFEAESNKIFDEIKRTGEPLSTSRVDEIKNKLSRSVKISIESEMEKAVLKFMTERPNEAFTEKAIGHALVIGRHSAAKTLFSLKEKGLVNKGVEKESNIILWQAKT